MCSTTTTSAEGQSNINVAIKHDVFVIRIGSPLKKGLLLDVSCERVDLVRDRSSCILASVRDIVQNCGHIS